MSNGSRKWVFTKHENGKWLIDRDGYILVNGKRQHRLIWEAHNGKIPDGMHIHHIDENKQNNAIENLQLVDSKLHHRIHSGCELHDGIWWKPCRECKKLKKESDYYHNERQIYFVCKECWKLRAFKRLKNKKLDLPIKLNKGEFPMFLDGNPDNKSIENIKIVNKVGYELLARGCFMKEDVWFKRCNGCNHVKEYYAEFYWNRTLCKKCYNKQTRSSFASDECSKTN